MDYPVLIVTFFVGIAASFIGGLTSGGGFILVALLSATKLLFFD